MPISSYHEEHLTPSQLHHIGLTVSRFWDNSIERNLDQFRAKGVDPMTVGPLCYVLDRFSAAYRAIVDLDAAIGRRESKLTLSEFVGIEAELSSTADEVITILLDLNPEYGPWPPNGTFHISVPPANRPPAERFVKAGLFRSAAECVANYR
jgi:hypothetical protein